MRRPTQARNSSWRSAHPWWCAFAGFQGKQIQKVLCGLGRHVSCSLRFNGLTAEEVMSDGATFPAKSYSAGGNGFPPQTQISVSLLFVCARFWCVCAVGGGFVRFVCATFENGDVKELEITNNRLVDGNFYAPTDRLMLARWGVVGWVLRGVEG